MNEEKMPSWYSARTDGSSLTGMAEAPRDVPIRDGSIRLGQFLKLADLIGSGSDAKAVIAAGDVVVNDEVEARRGRHLYPGDTVTIGELVARVSQG